MTKSNIGMIGLGTMGRNLVLNIADHGFNVSGYDKDPLQRDRLKNENRSNIILCSDVPAFIESLERPLKIILLVPAGKIVDFVIQDLKPFLKKDDILMDGGNSHFTDTDRRFKELQADGVHFMGMGVSGGEDGARYGPSMMPGSNRESYESLRPILEAIAAKSNGIPCVQFIGNGAAGHYTKMVHNGIEYAMMQMISEIYGLLKAHGFNNQELAHFFSSCNDSHLKSYLIEITADIFKVKDDKTGNDLIDMILDKAGQKGTGMWTSQSAFELMVPLTIIDSAVSARYISANKSFRTSNSDAYLLPSKLARDTSESLQDLCRETLYLGFILCYTQGLHLLKVASEKYNYQLHISNILDVWKGGCIIRSSLLSLFQKAYDQDSMLVNGISSPVFQPLIKERIECLQNFISRAIHLSIPTPAISTAYNYITGFISKQLSANLIQAQRDYFGAHTYERIDMEGSFHSEWNTN